MQMEGKESSLAKRQGIMRLIIGILVFGSIWGIFEATMGGALHMVRFPQSGAIMGGIGIAILGSALAIYRKPQMLFGIGVVAAAFKLLNVWIFTVPCASPKIVNPAMAIIFESLAFSIVASFLMDKMAKRSLVSIGAGILTGMVSASAYAYFNIYASNGNLFKTTGVGSIGGYIAYHGVIQAVVLGIFLAVGIWIGKMLSGRQLLAVDGSRLARYSSSAAIVVCCWGVSAVAVASGL